MKITTLLTGGLLIIFPVWMGSRGEPSAPPQGQSHLERPAVATDSTSVPSLSHKSDPIAVKALQNSEEPPANSMREIEPVEEVVQAPEVKEMEPAVDAPLRLFASVAAPVEWNDLNPAALRARKVSIQERFLEPSLEEFSIGEPIVIDGFDGETFEAEIVERKFWGQNQETFALRARFEKKEEGYITLSSVGGVVQAWISQPLQGRDLHVRYSFDEQSHVLLEVDKSRTQTLACETCGEVHEEGSHEDHFFAAEVERINQGIREGSPFAYGDTVFDVMVVYTPAALSVEGSLATMQATISEAFNKGNTVLENSETEVQINLVHSAEVAYVESGSAGTDLDNLEELGDGEMEIVHEWRDQYGADFVTIFIDTNSTGGLANRPSDHESPDRAFSLVRVQQADTTSYTTIHELAHNMGIGHSKTQSSQAYDGNGIATYAAGWQWADAASSATVGYCSVMTYENFDGNSNNGSEYDRVAYLSNPSVSFNGNPTGDAADGDAARVIREGRSLLAAYRNPGLGEATTFPYSQGFEAADSQWVTDSTNSTLIWEQRYSGSTPSGGTGPSSAETGTGYAYVESSFLDYTENNVAIIYADFDFAAVVRPQISFYVHMNDSGASHMGDLYLELSEDGGANWAEVTSFSGNQGSSWVQSVSSLALYAGDQVRLRFRGVVGSDFRSDIAVDSIVVEDLGPTANFAEHVAAYYPGISNDTRTGDPDGDGVVNFLEYALGRSLSVAEQTDLITASINEGTNSFVFGFLRGQSTVQYVVESTTDLEDWSGATTEWDSDTSPPDLVAVGAQQEVSIPITNPERFVRLVVSE